MAAIVGRASKQALLRVPVAQLKQQSNLVILKNLSKGKKAAVVLGGAAAVSGIGVAVAISTAVLANDFFIEPPSHPWYHKSIFHSYDAASARRGYQIYKQVCAACHSLKYVYYRNLIDRIMTEDEVKQESAEAQILDGPDEKGNMFLRNGKPSDKFPSPYPNDEAAMDANNGAKPPDLSYAVKSFELEEDYVFQLLTSYCDAPTGVELGEGQYFNPYFLGGTISMAQALYNEVIEYEDGTPCTQSQAAKDVVTFLAMTALPEMEDRKRMGMKVCIVFALCAIGSYCAKKTAFSYLKRKVVIYRGPTPKK